MYKVNSQANEQKRKKLNIHLCKIFSFLACESIAKLIPSLTHRIVIKSSYEWTHKWA